MSTAVVDLFLRRPGAKRSEPVAVLQRDEMDCGAACLAAICAHYGRHEPLEFFRRLVLPDHSGSSLWDIAQAAESVGLTTEGVEASLEELEEMRLPAIVMRGFHFVVLYAVDKEVATFCDPSIGIVRRPRAAFAAELTGPALLLTPGAGFRVGRSDQPSLRRYLVVARERAGLLVVITALSATLLALGLVPPCGLGLAAAHLPALASRGALALVALALAAGSVLAALVALTRSYFVAFAASKLDASFSALFVRHLFSLPLDFFRERRVGDVVSRFGELSNLRAFLTTDAVSCGLNVATLLLYSGILALFGTSLLSVGLGGLLAIFLLLRGTRRRFADLLADIFRAASQANGLMSEHLRNLATVKALEAEIAARWRFESRLLESLSARLALRHFGTLVDASVEGVQALVRLGVVLVSLELYRRGEHTLAQTLSLCALGGLVVAPAAVLAHQGETIHQFVSSLQRIDDIMRVSAESDETPEIPVPSSALITLHEVTFRYPGASDPTLDGITFSLAPGETVALVGPSGSGKSTLAGLLNRFHEPERGKISLNGVPLSEVPLATVRKTIGVVTQGNHLFSGSILENIALGDPYPSLERASTAAVTAAADDFIHACPAGYETRLGEGGTGLSGGQRQRLCLARALYSSPPVLVLDESTSHLDAVTERQILNSLRQRQGSTLFITHRLDTIRHADRIMVLEAGKILESGSHDELVARGGLYHRLVELQKGNLS